MNYKTEYKGKVWKFGDNLNTDEIHPARYFSLDAERVKEGLFKGLEREVVVSPGDIVVAGRNLGCGSSREVSAQAIKYNGIGLVIAESFARIFYRNLVNNGIVAIEYPGITDLVAEGDMLEVDLVKDVIFNTTTGEFLNDPAVLVDPTVREILKHGGLMAKLEYEYGRQQL